MASTSTGYQPRMIVREQPSSSGQVMSVSSGCKISFNTDAVAEFNNSAVVDLKNTAYMHLENTSYIDMSTGTYIKDDNVYVASSAMKLPAVRYGLIFLESTKNATYTIQTRPYKGSRIELIANTTFVHTVRGCTNKTVHFGATASTLYSIVLSPKAAADDLGVGVVLRGGSSNQWWALSYSTALVTGSTACT